MYLTFIAIGIVVIGIIVNKIVDGGEYDDTCVFTGVCWFLAIILMCVVGFGRTPQWNYVCDKSEEIYSIRSNVVSEGNFFLGSGSVNGVDYLYYFVWDEERQAYQKKKLKWNYSTTYIYEDDSVFPSIVRSVYKREYGLWIDFPWAEKVWGDGYMYRGDIKVYVPEGTVIAVMEL